MGLVSWTIELEDRGDEKKHEIKNSFSNSGIKIAYRIKVAMWS